MQAADACAEAFAWVNTPDLLGRKANVHLERLHLGPHLLLEHEAHQRLALLHGQHSHINIVKQARPAHQHGQVSHLYTLQTDSHRICSAARIA